MNELTQIKILRESMTRIEEGDEPNLYAYGDLDDDGADYYSMPIAMVKAIINGSFDPYSRDAGLSDAMSSMAQAIEEHPEEITKLIKTGGTWTAYEDEEQISPIELSTDKNALSGEMPSNDDEDWEDNYMRPMNNRPDY